MFDSAGTFLHNNHRCTSVMHALLCDFYRYMKRPAPFAPGYTPSKIEIVEALCQLGKKVCPYTFSLPSTDHERAAKDYLMTGLMLSNLAVILRERFTSSARCADALRASQRTYLALDDTSTSDTLFGHMLVTRTKDPQAIFHRNFGFGGGHNWYGILLMSLREKILAEDQHFQCKGGYAAAVRRAHREGKVPPYPAPPMVRPIEVFDRP